MTAVPKRNDLDARLQRLERAVRDLSRSNVIPLPGPPGPPGPIEGTTIEASVEMLSPLATFGQVDVTGNASVGGTLDAATVQATTVDATTVEAATATISSELTAPLVTAGRVVYTDRTFAQVTAAALSPVPTVLTDVPGLTLDVDVDSTSDIYLVMMVLDVDLVPGQTAPNNPLEARLMVNNALQTPNAHCRWVTGSVAQQRAMVAQVWLITGQAAGSRNFRIQARDTTASGSGGGVAYRINQTHSRMTIAQQQ